MKRFWNRMWQAMIGRVVSSSLNHIVTAVALAVLLIGCSMGNMDSDNSNVQATIYSSKEYGSISITTGNSRYGNSRALQVDDIVKADVTVSGHGMENIEVKDVVVEGGKFSTTIEGILIGKNRVIKVEPKTTIENVLSKMAGAEIFAVTDIEPGENKVSVNWATTAVGNVYSELIKQNYDVSNLAVSSVEAFIPNDVHQSIVNASEIAKDIKAGTAAPSNLSKYKITAGSVTINSGVEMSDVEVFISDPASQKLSSLSKTQTISGVTPGVWTVYVIKGKTIYHRQNVTVASGQTASVNIALKVFKPRLEDVNGNQIDSALETGATKTVYLKVRGDVEGEVEQDVTIYYEKTSDSSDPSNPTTSSTKYTNSGISVTVGDKIKAIATKIGFTDSDVAEFEFVVPSLGTAHPSTGNFSAVDEANWATANYALGAHVKGSATEFALYSKNATRILLEIYADDSKQPVASGKDAKYDYWMKKGSDNIWRAKVQTGAGTLYAFRCWGPNWTYDPTWQRGNDAKGFISDCDSHGNRFNPNKVLFDPYTREMSHDKETPDVMTSQNVDGGIYGTGSENKTYNGKTGARRIFDTGKVAPKSVVVNDTTSFGTKPEIPAEKAIIYEAHARGLTKHSSTANLTTILNGMEGFDAVQNVPADKQGTYAGAALMVPYLKALGVNTIELLPVHESDNDKNPDNASGGNYWAYMTYGYFAPDRRYSSDKSLGGPTREFKAMVKAFHDAEMEVYLDVVYNHTGEGGTWDGTGDVVELTSMHGIDNSTYFELCGTDNNFYYEHTGCGNDLQCDNAIVRQFVLDSLTYWTDEMGVDGFRFDLAPVLGHEKNGGGWSFNSNAKTLTDIAALGKTKNVEMIAEAWDAGGCYCVGQFPYGWGEWNGRYRDAIRGFVGTGNRGSANDYIYGDYNNFNDQGGSKRTVNFIVAHDGFTLADLSTYGGPGNANNSTAKWPFGPSDGGNSDNNSVPDSTSEGKRQTHRNYMALQAISRGVPMIVWGDEFGRTQNGNNNPYNVDSVATWNNYNMINTKSPHAVATGGTGVDYHNNFGTFGCTENVNGNFKFFQYLLNLRQNEPAFNQDGYGVQYNFEKENGGGLGAGDNCERIYIAGSAVSGGSDYCVLVNLYSTAVDNTFTIPTPPAGKVWKKLVDTQNAAETNYNYWDEKDAPIVSGSYGCKPRSIVILKACDKVYVAKCKPPVIKGSSPFSIGTTNVTITSPDGSDIYYTTEDGSTPDANYGKAPDSTSTKYTAPFPVNKTTIVRAVAVKSGVGNSEISEKLFVKEIRSTVAIDKSGVMLQGFNWSSAKTTSPDWYTTVTGNADAIKNTFSYMWCPPPSKTASFAAQGYLPNELNDLNNCYGTEAQLKAMITAIGSGTAHTKAIADIVINHRGGTTAWGDFTNPSWGVVKGSNYKAICSGDEGFVEPNSGGDSEMIGIPLNMRGQSDTGEGYGPSRDIDHTNLDVQCGIINWMNTKLRAAGFVGWRYDFVKGYNGKYVGLYDSATQAEFSVGEHWPSDGTDWVSQINGWISDTESGGYRSRAFDFVLKSKLNAVFGYSNKNNKTTAGSKNYADLADASCLYISHPNDAVTFVDNHDTGSTQKEWKLDDAGVPLAYALILTHPGYPCVAWQHYFTAPKDATGDDAGQYMGGATVAGTSKTMQEHINELISIRKDVGIGFDSVRETVAATKNYYAARIIGTKGEIIVVLGNGYTPTFAGYRGVAAKYSGTNFAIYEKQVVQTNAVTVTLSDENGIKDGREVFGWVWTSGSSPDDGEWIPSKSVASNKNSAVFDVPQGKNSIILVECYSGTTRENVGWEVASGKAGYIFRKTSDLTISGNDASGKFIVEMSIYANDKDANGNYGAKQNWLWNNAPESASNSPAKLFAYAWTGDYDATTDFEWIAVTKKAGATLDTGEEDGSALSLVMPEKYTNYELVRCHNATSTSTLPNFKETKEVAGRIYNKTEVKDCPKDAREVTANVTFDSYAPIGQDLTVTVNLTDSWDVWNDCAMFAWIWTNGADPEDGEWISVAKGSSNTSVTVTIPSAKNTKNRILLVRCQTGTTTPDWDITTERKPGRIYNKTGDIQITGITTTASGTFDGYGWSPSKADETNYPVASGTKYTITGMPSTWGNGGEGYSILHFVWAFSNETDGKWITATLKGTTLHFQTAQTFTKCIAVTYYSNSNESIPGWTGAKKEQSADLTMAGSTVTFTAQ